MNDAGVPVELTWKKGNKPLENDIGANLAEIRAGEDWVLRQMGKNGTVRMDKVPADQRAAFLQCVRAHKFYSEPNWGLGIGLFVLYWIILLLVAAAHSKLAAVLLIGGLAVSASLAMLYVSATAKVNKVIWWPVIILGVLGYLVTAIYSVLAIPFVTAIMTNNLHREVMATNAANAGAESFADKA